MKQALAGLWLMAACSSLWAADDAELGRRLFSGEQPLSARIAGHTDVLPGSASRCSNCHRTQAAGAASAPSFGPLLEARTLTARIARRGGPPSAYNATALCKLLREGIDPAWVMVAPAMPRYDASDAQCQALWAHLSRPAP